jgi:lipid-binding SYLF domain-containing protein
MKLPLPKLVTGIILALGSLVLCNCSSNPLNKMLGVHTDYNALARDSRAAISDLYRTNPEARTLALNAKGILVFPDVAKGGFVVGGMGGNGSLIRPDGMIYDFYRTGGISYGLQAGFQKFGYALFLMDDEAFHFINEVDGWEVGSSPSVVIVKEGMAASFTTTTMHQGTYAFFFNQRGLMAGLGLQGSKITRIKPGE